MSAVKAKKKNGRPRKSASGELLYGLTVRMSDADRAALSDLSILYGSMSDACAIAVRALYSTLTATQKQAISAVKDAQPHHMEASA